MFTRNDVRREEEHGERFYLFSMARCKIQIIYIKVRLEIEPLIRETEKYPAFRQGKVGIFPFPCFPKFAEWFSIKCYFQ